MVKRYEELTISDDFMFGKTMGDKVLCQDVLEQLLEEIYNCAADPEKVPENLWELYDYIRSGKVGGDLSQRIDEAVCIARKNEEWRSEYMKELLHDDDVREEGREAGRAEERSFLLTLISKMSLGGDTDKVARLNDSEVLLAMRKKYGLE